MTDQFSRWSGWVRVMTFPYVFGFLFVLALCVSLNASIVRWAAPGPNAPACCFLSACLASGSSLLSFVLGASRLHLGQAPAVSAESPLVVQSHHSIVPTPSASVLASCESWESFLPVKVKFLCFLYSATGPITWAAVGGCWWHGPASQQTHVVFLNLQDCEFIFWDYHGKLCLQNVIRNQALWLPIP